MKIGDRIRIIEVLQEGQDYWSEYTNLLGKQRAVVEETGTDFECPNIVSKDLDPENDMDVNISLTSISRQGKHVATMVITKLKCQCCGTKVSEFLECTRCDCDYCENCQAPYNQFSQIDFNLCKSCYER